MKRLLVATVAALGALASLPAAAQFQKPEDAVKYRKASFQVMAMHFGRVGAMANGKAPFDANVAAANADIAAYMAKLPFAGFVEGTSGTEKGSAKASVWTERAKFDDHTKKMQEELTRLAAAAKTSTNADQLKTAFGKAAGTCKGCHDDFRNQ